MELEKKCFDIIVDYVNRGMITISEIKSKMVFVNHMHPKHTAQNGKFSLWSSGMIQMMFSAKQQGTVIFLYGEDQLISFSAQQVFEHLNPDGE